MKVKTSVTLSSELLKALDRLPGGKTNRSATIERALWNLIEAEKKTRRTARDLKIYERHAKELNQEAMDALSYQVPL